MVCPACGTTIPPGSVRCDACGTSLSASEAPTKAGAPSTKSPPLHDFMPGELFAERYTIVEKIGAGGMGQVYKALDREVGQSLALKLAVPGTLRAAGLKRFRRELALARQAAHPNVCRVYDLGECAGVHYISMEYIDGQTLRDWTQAVGRLSSYQTVKLGRQICAGLNAIHQQSIVHRDLKPSNVMLDRSGRAVLMDFGLAHHPRSDEITAEGDVLGTLAYLSPEQARGETETRSDIYSLGLLLFEMLTGKRPPGDEEPLPLGLRDRSEGCSPPSLFAPDVPPALDALVLRCLEHDPRKRFQTVLDVDAALAKIEESLPLKTSPDSRRISTRTRSWILAAFGFVTAGALVWSLLTASGPPRGSAGLAVLPLSYRGSAESEYIARLLPLVILRNLEPTPTLELVPFDTSRTYTAGDDIASVARELGVGWVVRGELRALGKTFEGELSLFRAEGTAKWSRTFTGDTKDVLDVAERAADEIVEAMGKRRGNLPGERIESRALSLYLEGKSLLEGWDLERNHARAAAVFEKALRVQDDFAEAHAGLALALWTLYEETREAELVERSLSEAQRAVDLAPELPESHLALGVVQLGRGLSAEAAASFAKAQELAPADDSVSRRIARAHAALGREEEAEKMYQHAIDLRPGYWENHNYLGAFYVENGRLDEAVPFFQRVIELRPNSDTGYSNLAVAHILAGELEKAVPLLLTATRLNPTAPQAHNNLGFIYYATDRFREAAEQFEQAIDLGADDALYYGNLGDSYRMLGRDVRARAAYARAIELGEARLEVNPEDTKSAAELAMALAGYGRCDDARGRALEVAGKPVSPTAEYYIAIAYALCGARDQAIDHARTAIEGGVDIRTSPDLRELDVTPR